MDRLLSPNETKFWLLDRTAPMNTVAVIQCHRRLDGAVLERDSDFALPVSIVGRQQRPRWSSAPDHRQPGVVVEISQPDSSPDGWLPVAARLLNEPTGVAGQPSFRAVILHHDGTGREGAGQDGAKRPVQSTLLFAVNHALADWRSSLALADAFLAGRHPGDLEPPIEELLPEAAFASADAPGLIDGWYRTPLSARWEAIGLDRLAAVMPPAHAARLDWAGLSATETAALRQRCRAEGASTNSALAVAMAGSGSAVRSVALAVDLSRIVVPSMIADLPPSPGITVSHIYADVPQTGPQCSFWQAARQTRAAVAAQVASGAAADALLILPRVLLLDEQSLIGDTASLCITSPPVDVWLSTHPDDRALRFGMGPARAGGTVVHRLDQGDHLQLVVSSPDTDHPALSAGELVSRLRAAITA